MEPGRTRVEVYPDVKVHEDIIKIIDDTIISLINIWYLLRLDTKLLEPSTGGF